MAKKPGKTTGTANDNLSKSAQKAHKAIDDFHAASAAEVQSHVRHHKRSMAFVRSIIGRYAPWIYTGAAVVVVLLLCAFVASTNRGFDRDRVVVVNTPAPSSQPANTDFNSAFADLKKSLVDINTTTSKNIAVLGEQVTNLDTKFTKRIDETDAKLAALQNASAAKDLPMSAPPAPAPLSPESQATPSEAPAVVELPPGWETWTFKSQIQHIVAMCGDKDPRWNQVHFDRPEWKKTSNLSIDSQAALKLLQACNYDMLQSLVPAGRLRGVQADYSPVQTAGMADVGHCNLVGTVYVPRLRRCIPH